jgi:NAD(P)-dependent dehydrogenase (short-subunit alcohol dehydrogenase family)
MTGGLASQFDLDGRVALITGSANILGPEFAAALAEYGAQVALADINAESCTQVAREIRETFGVQAKAYEIDVADEKEVGQLVNEVVSTFGQIDILINAAANKPPGYFRPFVEYDLDDWNRVMDVNLTGMFLTAKHVVPHFIAQEGGTIINIASIYGIVGPDPRVYEGSWYLDQQINTPAIYAASKGGVVAFTRYLATTLASYRIRANSITPGGVYSGQNEEFAKRYSDRVPLGRMGNREELRGAALFLASEASSYITGHNLVVDGGFSVW